MNEDKLLQFLAGLQHQLKLLKEREAKAGNNAPLELRSQIDNHEQAITLVEAGLAGEIAAEELAQQLESLELRLDSGGVNISDISGGDIDIGNIVTGAVGGDVVSGDKFSGDKVAGDKVEGDKSFVKVVFEGIPTWVLLTLPAFAALTAFFAWIYFVPTTMPLNTFNVAVAEFGQIDAQGNVSASEDGRNLSEWMFNELQAEYKNWPTSQPTIWHDSMGILGKRGKISLIPGSTPEERRAAAQEVAEQIGANMVIYGNIAVDRNPVDFRPEFYVAAIRNEADEIIGQHQLGSPIQVQLPIDLYDDRTGAFFEEKLGVRVEALVWFTRGLALDLSGRHKEAWETLREAETEFKNWDDDEGKEILYYFIGREALFLSNKDINRDVDLDTEELLAQAETAFSESLNINPEYTRGHIGLGGVFFQKAQDMPPEERLQAENLNLAITHYRQALENALQSAETQIEIKSRLGLGISYRLQGDAYVHAQQYDKADSVYELAIEEIESALALLSQDQHRLIAQTYLGLGAAYEGRAYITRYIKQNEAESKLFYEDAHTAYERCVDHADKEFYDSLLQEIKTVYCSPYRQEVKEILDSL